MAQIIPVNWWGWAWWWSGEGDMKKSVYDPNNVNANAFDYDNFINTPTIPTKTSDLNNDSWFITWITSSDVTTALWYTPYNSTNPNWYVTNTIINDTAYGSSWDADTTHSPTKNAVYDKISSMDTAISGNTTAISTINSKIPSAATSSNQLADKDYVNDGINSVTAYYITKNAQGDQWATRAELFAATTFYSGGVVRVPTKNDYTIVLADENHDNATTRYIYNSGWEYQYTVNETALTQAQLDALNSWITSWKVSTYDWYATTISWKQDALTLPATPTQWHLVTWWADNKSLTDWWAVPTWVPAWWTNGQVLTNVNGTPTWANPTWWIQEAPNSPITWIKYVWRGSEAQYQALSQYYTDTPWDTEFRTYA